MRKRKSGGTIGGLLYGVFNIGFTVVMFALPSICLGYWYFYIRDPGSNATATQRAAAEPAQQGRLSAGTNADESSRRSSGTVASNSFDPLIGQNRAKTERTGAGRTGTNQAFDSESTEAPEPVRQQRELRTWRDKTGDFSVSARFYSAIGESVTLNTSDERQITVAIDQLSDADRAYLREVFRSKGIRPDF